MEGFLSALKMKRKSIGEVDDEFADSYFSSPVTKVRRLDPDLPPILEEEYEIPMRFEPSVPQEQSFRGSSYGDVQIGEIHSENEERAIVLANPMDSPLLQLQPNFSLSVAPHILSGLKNQVRLSSESSPWRIITAEEQLENSNSHVKNECLAVVPWVPLPSPLPPPDAAQSSAEVENMDMMDADYNKEPTMDGVESMSIDQTHVNQAGTAAGHPHQWQLQHCFDPQPIQSPLTPVTWHW